MSHLRYFILYVILQLCFCQWIEKKCYKKRKSVTFVKGCFMDNKIGKAQVAFIDALLNILKSKPFDQISVSELSEVAQYDRRTFYRYFQSKSDILYLYCASLLAEMAESMKKEPLTPQSGFLSYFEFWGKHRDFLLLLEKQHLLYFLGEKQDQLLYEHVGTVVHDDLPKELSQVSEFSLYAYYFTLGGLWQTLVLWIRTGMKQTPKQLTDYILMSFTEMQKLI